MNYLNIIFNSFLGPVENSSIFKALSLMVKGMFGIFVTMLIIYFLISLLGKLSK